MQAAIDNPNAEELRLARWRTLLLNSSKIKTAEIDEQYILDCIDTLHGKLFSNRTLVYVTDVKPELSNQHDTPTGSSSTAQDKGDQTPRYSKGITTKYDELDDLLACFTSKPPALRLISIVRGNSLQPFRISSDAMGQLIKKHAVQRPFLDLLFGFRSQTELSEKGCSVWCASSNGGQNLLCYQLRYRERNFRKSGSDEWSERQIGVYHDFSPVSSTMILFHAKEKTTARTRLQDAFEKAQLEPCHITFNLQLHVILLSSYVDNWRWYLDELGRNILTEENKGVTDDLKQPYAISFPTLQKLRDREADLTTAAVVLKSTITTIQAIKDIAVSLRDDRKCCCSEFMIDEALQRILLRCQNYHSGIEVLSERVSKLIQLVADGLNHKNQMNNADISTSLYKLTEKSVDDNAVIRVVTIITLIYLPTQFVATFFGMNFTSFEKSSLIFARNWWLFLVAAVPLTILTLAAVGTAMLVESNKRHNRPPLSLSTLFKRQHSAGSLPPVNGKGG